MPERHSDQFRPCRRMSAGELRERLPADVAIGQTARGYHCYFLTAGSVPAGVLERYSAEIYGDGQALHTRLDPPLGLALSLDRGA